MAPELRSVVRLLLLAVVWELSAQGDTERHINPEVRNKDQRWGVGVRNKARGGESGQG